MGEVVDFGFEIGFFPGDDVLHVICEQANQP